VGKESEIQKGRGGGCYVVGKEDKETLGEKG
jgi:hypothetical protein